MRNFTTALQVTYQATTSLNSNGKNPRIHSKKQVRQIAQSIESFGFNVPLLVDDDLNVIAGHGRLLAVRQLGWEPKPTEALSPESQPCRRGKRHQTDRGDAPRGCPS
jgi:ParB-like nuclease domain